MHASRSAANRRTIFATAKDGSLFTAILTTLLATAIAGCRPAADVELSDTNVTASPASTNAADASSSAPQSPVDVDAVGNNAVEDQSVTEPEAAVEAPDHSDTTQDEELSANEPPSEEKEEEQPIVKEEERDPGIASPDQPDLPVDPTWKALTADGKVWIDLAKKTVIVSGKVCMREGPLEMFACTPNTKEYESVVMVNSPAFMVHGALLAVGAEPGSPVKFSPYVGANGPIIDIFVEWLDEDGNKRRERAQEWIRHDKTGKPMAHDFVFGGSGFWTDEETGEQRYFAEGGELVCVSNFSTATIDLPVRSPQDNQGLWFTAFTDKIPKLETKIHLVLVPRAGRNPNASTEK